MKEEIKNIVSDFFNKFGVKYESIEIKNEEENIFLIKIKSEESGLLIGPHGRNLDNISQIIKLIIRKQISDKIKIHIEVNDYIKSKDERLQSLIISKIKYVEKSGNDLKLPFYGAYDRKKIHGFVSDYKNDQIYTKSIGEGNERRLYICKISEKLIIDIDGNDI